MEAIVEQKKSAEDYLQLPEGAPYQLLNGELIMSPSPNRKHQKLSGNIFRIISNLCVEKKIGEVYFAPFDVHLDEANIVQPDICFFSAHRLHSLSERGAEAAPDLIIELLSPSNAYYDLRYKMDLYEKFGVQEYFIVDPQDNTVLAYRLIDGRYKEVYREKNSICSEVLQKEIKW